MLAVVVAFLAELPEVLGKPEDPLPEADPDWLVELGAGVIVDELLLGLQLGWSVCDIGRQILARTGEVKGV